MDALRFPRPLELTMALRKQKVRGAKYPSDLWGE
jgi:hypothetical protein